MDYFAKLPSAEIGAELDRRRDRHREYLTRSGRLELWKTVYKHYYKAAKTRGKIWFSGEQNEFTNVDVADFRNILTHLKVMTTNQRPAFEPRATNTDTKSQAQTILCSGLLEYYQREREVDRYIDKATEFAIAFGDGFIGLDWDATAGKDYGTDERGKVIREGDLKCAVYHPIDVAFDVTRPRAMGQAWYIVRDFESRWDLAAKYAKTPEEQQELADKLRAVASEDRTMESIYEYPEFEQSDIVPVHTFIHARTDALPAGRLVRYVSSDTILIDTELPFDELPMYRIAPSDQEGTPFGYTIAFDLLPLQEAIDRLASSVLTNQAAFGISNILIPVGSNLSSTDLGDGLNAITYTPVGNAKPEPLNLTSTPAELFKFIENLREYIQVLSGVNSVARGQPEASLKSGAALALVQSMAIQFNSDLQRSYANLAADVGTGIVKILKRYARTKRVAMIAGKSNRSYMKAWTGSDLDRIDRVTVDLGNPLMRTTAGKVNMAEQLLGAGMIQTPDQYIQVLTTGKLEPLIEGKQAELMNIRSENETLSEGGQARAVATDNHALHIQEHKVVLSSVESRQDSTVVEATLSHIQEHLDLLRNTDPGLLILLGQQPIPPAMPPQGAPTPGGPPPELSGEMEAAPVEQPGPQPQLPNMPVNPLTGSPADITGGMQ